MTHSVTHYAHKFADKFHNMVHGYELQATAKNLKWVMRHSKEEILRYQFKDGVYRYSALEYSIKSADLDSVSTLIKLGIPLDFASAQGRRSALHFFIDCLQENYPPYLELFHLLLDHSDVNIQETTTFQRPLEWALMHMSFYKQVHWEVIELLLQKGCIITENEYTHNTPFMILKNVHCRRMIRNIGEERIILERLMNYLKLEKKYHPETDSSLTLEEFKFHTSNLHSIITGAALVTSHNSLHRKDSNEAEEKDMPEAERRPSVQEREHQEVSEHYDRTGNAFEFYQKCFLMLVKDKTEKAFESCFASWELPVVSIAIARNLFK